MDARTLIDVVCVAFGAGSFTMGAVVAKLMLARFETNLERRFSAEREWMQANFIRKDSSPLVSAH